MTKKVLVVEDSPTMRQLISFALRPLNVDLMEAENGVHALKLIKENDFALALVDINMPLLDGLKLIQMVRSDPGCSGLQIVIVSTEGSPEVIEKAKRLGIQEYITKPIQVGKVQSVVKKLLSRSIEA